MEIGPDAFERLPDVLRGLAPDAEEVVVVQDPEPMRRGADELKPWLRRGLEATGYRVALVELQPGADGEVHADFEQLERVQSQLRSGGAARGLRRPRSGRGEEMLPRPRAEIDGGAGDEPVLCKPARGGGELVAGGAQIRHAGRC
ncbi:MAG TPA: hypothetical protein VH231_17685 [Solirubrobacteraceae bacterium]|nr:hypothetical protein [Solirubrobacteraceae bacterium]